MENCCNHIYESYCPCCTGECSICESKDVLDIIDEMRESGDFHNPTLDELEQRLQ